MIPFQISDHDVEAIGAFLKRDFSSDECLSALKESESVDIQAAPGSGKTSLLVAKLALLRAHWPHSRQGICVLSHTNIARSEIEKQLVRHPTGSGLLSYPHFVGTIQAFAHEFLALPYLRGIGVHSRVVDNERFAAAARRRAPAYWRVKNHLDRHPQTADLTLSTLRVSGPDLNVTSDGSLPRATTDTFKEFVNLKSALMTDGVFRFDDMFAFAQRALREIPTLRQVLSTRFPVIFFDEMQDTDDLQEALFVAAFDESCTVQRFGDRNQGIFDNNEREQNQSSFPRAGHIDLAHSRRFGPQIAAAASALTIAQPQVILGDPIRPEKAHTIFLFDEASIGEVLPAFGRRILEQFPGVIPPEFVAKAVASRKSGSGQTLPRHIGDYWPAYDAVQTGRSGGHANFIGYVRRARSLVAEQQNCHDASAIVWDGVLAFLHSHSCKLTSGDPIARKWVLRELERSNADSPVVLQMLVWRMCLGPDPTSTTWVATVADLTSALKSILPEGAGSGDEEFLLWEESAAEGLEASATAKKNVYQHKEGGRQVSINLNTIHGVKGETHNATLVLTTVRSKVFDLKEALGPLSGIAKARKIKTVHQQLMLLFVGITRPRDLLCLAVVADHCTQAHQDALVALGWTIQDLRGTNAI